METNIVNLTPHELNIRNSSGEMVSVPSSGTIARVAENRVQLESVGGFAVSRADYGAVENLPEPQPATIYVVSALTLQRVIGRTDVFAPGVAIRDEAGKIIGCDGLSAAPEEIPVHPSVLWAIESDATDSYGYGGQFWRDVQNVIEGKPAISDKARAVALWLEKRTPQLIEFGSWLGVTITQERNVFRGELKIKVRVDDGMGDWRDASFTVRQGEEVAMKARIETQIEQHVAWAES